MLYKCIRCHYSTEVKGNYKAHLNRKKSCDSTYSTITCEELLDQLINDKYVIPVEEEDCDNDIQIDIDNLTKKEIVLKYKEKINELNKEIDDICESQEQFVIQEKETYNQKVEQYQVKLQKLDDYIETRANQLFEERFDEMANYYRLKIEKQMKKDIIFILIDKNKIDNINIDVNIQTICNKGSRVIDLQKDISKNMEYICNDFLDMINARDETAIEMLVKHISENNNQSIDEFYFPPTKDNIVVPPNVTVNEEAIQDAYNNSDYDKVPAVIKILEKGEVQKNDNLPPQYIGKKKIVVQAYDPQDPEKKINIIITSDPLPINDTCSTDSDIPIEL